MQVLGNGRTAFVKKQGDGILGQPKRFVGVKQLYAVFPILQLEDEEFGSAVAYSEVLFHSRLLLGEFLVHFEKPCHDVGFRGVFGEAVGLQNGGIVGAVGLAEFGRHGYLVI